MMLALEKRVMMHYLQGKGFFKQNNYELARQEFQRVLQLNADYHPALVYLDRIEDIEIESKRRHEERYQKINQTMDNVLAEKKGERVPSTEEKLYRMSEQEARKLDAYTGNRQFEKMVNEQRITVVNKAAQVKKDINEVLDESRRQEIIERLKSEHVPFVIQGFEEKEGMAPTAEQRVEQVKAQQADADMGFYFNRQKKLEHFYERGVMAYKQNDFRQAKRKL